MRSSKISPTNLNLEASPPLSHEDSSGDANAFSRAGEGIVSRSHEVMRPAVSHAAEMVDIDSVLDLSNLQYTERHNLVKT